MHSNLFFRIHGDLRKYEAGAKVAANAFKAQAKLQKLASR